MKVTRNLIIGNTVYMAAGGMVAQLISLFVLPLFVGRLGSDLYGVYVLGSLFLGYIGTFSAGFNEGIQKHISEAWAEQDWRKLAEVIASGMGILFAIGLSLGGLAFLGADLLVDFFRVDEQFRQQSVCLLRLCGSFAVFYWPMQVTTLILRARLRLKWISVLKMLQAVVQSVVMILSVLYFNKIYWIKTAELAVMTVFWVPTLILALKMLPSMQWQWFRLRRVRLREMAGFSFGMMYSALLVLLTTRIDNVVIGRMLGMSAITAYVVVSKYFYISKQYVGMLFANIMPTVYNLHAQKDTVRLERLLNRGIRYRAMISFPMALTGLVVMRPFIKLWMGPEFLPYAVWGEAMALIPLFTAQGLAGSVLCGTGRVRVSNIIQSLQVFLNLIISIALTPFMGIGGPILGTLLTVVFVGDAAFYPYFCRLLGVSSREGYVTIIKTIACCLPPVLAGRWVVVRWGVDSWLGLVLMAGCVFGLQYLTLLFVMLDREDSRNIGSVFGQIPIIGKSLERVFLRLAKVT